MLRKILCADELHWEAPLNPCTSPWRSSTAAWRGICLFPHCCQNPSGIFSVDQLSEAIEFEREALALVAGIRLYPSPQPVRHDSGLSTRPVRTFTSLGLQVSMPIFHFSSARAREAAGRALFQQQCRALRWSRPTVVSGRVRSRDFEIYWLQNCYFKNI